jgi:hypothetical protein
VNVPDTVRDCVLFLGDKEGGHFRPRTTAFIVTWKDQEFGFDYLVTAEHNISGFMQKKWDLWCRSNLKGGGVYEEQLGMEHWRFHPDNAHDQTDVAVSAVGFRAQEDYRSVPLNGNEGIAGTADALASSHIGIGDEVAITGLFRSHYGQQRNVPIVRIGNIAMMKGERVYTQYCGHIEAYLIEARSISGLSGSPVFVQVPPFQVLGGEIRQAQGRRLLLLGLMHGHFDVQNLNEDVVLDDQREGTRGINTGVGVVIPVEKIIETINHPDLVAMRAAAIKHKRAASSKTTGQ